MKLRPPALVLLLLAGLIVLKACRKEGPDAPGGPGGPGTTPFDPVPYVLEYPAYFPEMPIPPDNPMTEQGVQLGRHLFYEERLSGDHTMSCASCHMQGFSFSDPARFSTGIMGQQGTRNSMALINLGWEERFFWDGRAMSLEEQIFFPVRDPVEMHQTWPAAVAALQADSGYRALFAAAFGTTTIDSVLVSKAIAQFVRTMISANSKFDKYKRNEVFLTIEEQMGLDLTRMEGGDPAQGGQWGADCFHCHPDGGGRFTDGLIRNNGLDPASAWTDLGLGGITGLPQDFAKFKTPTLRNVAVTGPYMHDGRFETLEEVIDHYDSGGHPSPTIDPNMKFTQGGLSLTPEKKAQLIAFLHTLTDHDFFTDERFSDPGPP
ncbi:MAG: cytochrome c peroxidase [Flavobacteriales bacterium]|jgi:cytochrome c peroxidase|nr:cytochrome c peroxidase [Flavobacteriales bacterium]